jgi:integrase
MPTIRLIKRSIEALPQPSAGQMLYRDEELRGFGLRVGARSKVFFVESQAKKKTVRVTIGPYGPFSPEQARREAIARLAEMARGINPNEAKRTQRDELTVAEAFELFFAARPKLAPVTVKGYRRTAEIYLADWASRPMSEITRQMVLRAHQRVTDEHGAVTANNVMRHFRSVYNFAAATREDTPPNPVGILRQARAWAPERRRRTVIAVHQLPAWWRAVVAETDLARDFLLVALFTGMRRSEIARLRWDEVDLPGRMIRLPTTKNGDPLDLPLSGFLFDVIARRRALVGQSEWVFPGPGVTGHVVETKSFTRRVVERSGVEFTLHDLRRTFITIAESLGTPPYSLKQLLNHRVSEDVTGGYIVVTGERLRGPVQQIADRILEIVAPTPQLVRAA